MSTLKDADIYLDLRDRLTQGTWPFGSKLKASVLCSDYDCAASTLREALFRLSADGFVDFQEQRGFRVPAESPTLLNELLNLRILIEAEGAVLSMRAGGVAWEARLSAAHHHLLHIEKRILDHTDRNSLFPLWLGAEHEFHATLISACGSEVMKQSHATLYARTRQQLVAEDRQFTRLDVNIDRHCLIVEAALGGDEAAVRHHIHKHLART